MSFWANEVDMKQLLLAIVVVTAALAQQPVASGPAVGARLPEFNVVGADGRTHTLKSVLGAKGALLVFFRSADW